MAWIEYMVMAAQHSKGNAKHWFRYLRKYVDKCGVLFTEEDINTLCNSHELTPFQRVSVKATFTEGSPTRQYVTRLNEPGRRDVLSIVKAKIEKERA